MTTNITYNGWTNKATWLVKLWMDNDQYTYSYWIEQVNKNTDSYQLADELEHYHQDILPEHTGLLADLLSSALAEVNWIEIAQSLISDLSE
jgi:hypothetical protein